jgi:phosphoribosyl-AMP cyclohydrolase
MTEKIKTAFAPQGNKTDVEEGLTFQPKFDADGLIPVIVTDQTSGGVLMFAWMNGEALSLTIETGLAHFWSRSRGKLWKKGEESGNLLSVHEIQTDCDQDVIWLKVDIGGEGVACHTGKRSCFYRTVETGAKPAANAKLKMHSSS